MEIGEKLALMLLYFKQAGGFILKKKKITPLNFQSLPSPLHQLDNLI